MDSITLRPWTMRDAPRLLEILSSTPDLDRQLPSVPEDLAGCEDLIRGWREQSWVWCLSLEGSAQGLVGIGAGSDLGRVYYWLAQEARGRGLAARAVIASCNWALASEGGGLRRLELGYRINNPASGRVASAAGFVVEGREREKFVVDGEPVDVLTAGRLASDPWPDVRGVCLEGTGPVSAEPAVPPGPRTPWHHLELWTSDFDRSAPAWDWLLTHLGAVRQQQWHQGRSWELRDGSYVVLEQSADGHGTPNRCGPGMNHVAWTVPEGTGLEELRAEALGHGWRELFADRFPTAGGPEHTALFLEHAVDGVEAELVQGASD